MFIDNKYKKWYDKLMSKRQLNILNKKSNYCESHHIIPKSLGGSNTKNNLVLLSAREHFIAHLLLTKFTVGQANQKMHWALHRIAFSSSRKYSWFKINHSKFLIDNHPSKNNISWSEKVSSAVAIHWNDNDLRRSAASKKMLETNNKRKRETPEIYYNHQTTAAKLGAQAAKNKLALRIEYNGIVYLGWKELCEHTGITKHLYNKYYVKGIDPMLRKGHNGPSPKMKGESA
jgi:hypothetical protein